MEKLRKIFRIVIIFFVAAVAFFYIAFDAPFGYFRWETAYSDVIDARTNLENLIALRQLMCVWDKREGVPAEFIITNEKDIKKYEEVLKNVEKDYFDYITTLPLLEKLIFKKEMADNIHALKLESSSQLQMSLNLIILRSIRK